MKKYCLGFILSIICMGTNANDGKNMNDYKNYLLTLEFRESSKNDKEKFLKSLDIDKSVLNSDWYIYEGNLTLPELDISDIPLLITGDLSLKQNLLTVDNSSSLIVLGKTNVKSIFLLGETHLIGGLDFETALITTVAGPKRYIKNAKGPLIYNGSDSSILENPKATLCLVDRPEDKYEGNFFSIIKEKFIDFEDSEEEKMLSKEEFIEAMKDYADPYKTYQEYLYAEGSVDITGIANELKKGNAVFK